MLNRPDSPYEPYPVHHAYPLTEVLHQVRMTGLFYCRSELTGPWGAFMPPMPDCMWFHVVTEGKALIEVDDTIIEAGPGSFVLIPHGRGHYLKSQRNVATPNVLEVPQTLVSERYSLLRYGGGGEGCTLFCGVVRMETGAGLQLERMLPPVLHLAELANTDWMASTLRMIAEEARVLKPGGETVLTRLADVLVIQAIRTWLDSDPVARTGWVGALRDSQIGLALSSIWRAPNEHWSVESLARVAAMSRSAFAARFMTLVGEPPMQHVTRVRMQVASVSLREQRATVGELSSKLGYRSQAAFARAFKRMTGSPPGAMRRQLSERTD